MFGRKKRNERRLAEHAAGDAPHDRLVVAIHGGASIVVDGDAVASYGWPHLPINTQRNALIDYCATLAKVCSVEPTAFKVFFDASVDDAVPRSKAVTIERTDDRTSAAARAIEEIEAVEVSVAVWSDANAISLRAAGATVYLPDDLLDSFLDLNS